MCSLSFYILLLLIKVFYYYMLMPTKYHWNISFQKKLPSKYVVKGILSTTIVIFSYPKLLSFCVLTFIKWRLNTELLVNTLRNVVFRFKQADHRYWKLINHALTWERPNLFLSMFMPVARMLQHVVFVYLANTAVFATH